MTAKSKAQSRPLFKLAKQELDALSAEFDREFIADTFGAPAREVKKRLDQVKRKRGRPRVGAGSTTISVTVEKQLLKRVDRFAKRHGLSRARLIALGLSVVLKSASTPSANSKKVNRHKRL